MKKGYFKQLVLKAVQFILNPRLLLCFGIAWMITNGWSYVMLAIGTWLGIPWMIAVATAYLTILWLPSPEKILTCAIAIILLRLIFPKDKHTLGVLQDMRRAAIDAFKNRKKKKKQKKNDSEDGVGQETESN
ncbi:MAG: hypothetical protein IJW70_12295 [Clostridia bacterium]|nr:hypothetical protein [Clostridia bacterium]MBQ7380446.1 hypothetical protein [Clostridia bacterium]